MTEDEGPEHATAQAAARALMVQSLRVDIGDERVLDVIGSAPRERFIDPELRSMAYDDRPLPIGHGQTISQPRMAALMLQELGLRGEEKVLEVGTGSGYQAALLAELAREVVSVEIVPGLAEKATRVLAELGYTNVAVHLAGEELGWAADGPYDANHRRGGGAADPPVASRSDGAGGAFWCYRSVHATDRTSWSWLRARKGCA